MVASNYQMPQLCFTSIQIIGSSELVLWGTRQLVSDSWWICCRNLQISRNIAYCERNLVSSNLEPFVLSSRKALWYPARNICLHQNNLRYFTHLPHHLRGRHATLRPTCWRARWTCLAIVVQVSHEGPWSNKRHLGDEDKLDSESTIVSSVSSWLYWTCLRMPQHAIGKIFFNLDIQYGGGNYEASTLRTGCQILNVRDGRKIIGLNSRRRSQQHIHAQSSPRALECSEACVQIFSGHKRLRHPIRAKQDFRCSQIHRLRLC